MGLIAVTGIEDPDDVTSPDAFECELVFETERAIRRGGPILGECHRTGHGLGC